MPFVRGRYRINPVMGEALEAARDLENALQAQAQGLRDGDAGALDSMSASSASAKGPIHHVEIESAKLVPASSGRGVRGYLVRVARQPAAGDRSAQASSYDADSGGGNNDAASVETHAFTDHRDVVNFLGNQFAKDCQQDA